MKKSVRVMIMTGIVWFISISSVFAEDTLKMLIWEGYAPPEQVKKFEAFIKKKYGKPVKLQISHKVSDVQDFYDAIRGRRTHIISPAHNIIKDMRFGYIRKKLIMPINPDNIPNYKNVLPTLQNAPYITDDKDKVYGVPLAHGPYGLAYNTAFFGQAPESWNVLWDPAYKGKYTISRDYYEANVYITALSEGLRGEKLYDYDILKQKKI